ncbi:hypothetical protein [Vibrio sp. 1CM23M]|uniref:hypothetical protein n=1 Tax=Vibrio sp. 1CM23M TaxID=2929164 RepID=UPI0020BE1222|nr:hypothetical protein [Vibrio sp. 1CM23M]MCK8072417.1 hypothetical protein [Vibrio sp. 1CM23M]
MRQILNEMEKYIETRIEKLRVGYIGVREKVFGKLFGVVDLNNANGRETFNTRFIRNLSIMCMITVVMFISLIYTTFGLSSAIAYNWTPAGVPQFLPVSTLIMFIITFFYWSREFKIKESRGL